MDARLALRSGYALADTPEGVVGGETLEALAQAIHAARAGRAIRLDPAVRFVVVFDDEVVDRPSLTLSIMARDGTVARRVTVLTRGEDAEAVMAAVQATRAAKPRAA